MAPKKAAAKGGSKKRKGGDAAEETESEQQVVDASEGSGSASNGSEEQTETVTAKKAKPAESAPAPAEPTPASAPESAIASVTYSITNSSSSSEAAPEQQVQQLQQQLQQLQQLQLQQQQHQELEKQQQIEKQQQLELSKQLEKQQQHLEKQQQELEKQQLQQQIKQEKQQQKMQQQQQQLQLQQQKQQQQNQLQPLQQQQMMPQQPPQPSIGGAPYGMPSLPTSVPVASVPAGPVSESHTIEVPENKVGTVIGPKGATIMLLQTNSGCKMHMLQDGMLPGQMRILTFTGTRSQIQIAVDMTLKVIAEGPQALHPNALSGGPTVTTILDLEQSLVGRVIGGSGATIKEMQTRTGASIKIDQSMDPGLPRKIILVGTQVAVQNAIQLVNYVIENGPGLPPLGIKPGIEGMGQQPVPASQLVSHIMEVAKIFVGKIIGRGGEMIVQLQQQTGARVQIDQSVPDGMPCKVCISGNQAQVQAGINAINALVAEGPTTGQHSKLNGNFQQFAPQQMPQQMMGYGQPMGMQPQYGQQMGVPFQQQRPPVAYGQQPQQMGYGMQQPPMQQQPYPQVQPMMGQPQPQQQQYGFNYAQQAAPGQVQQQQQPQPRYGAPAQQQAPGTLGAPQAAPQVPVQRGQWAEYKDATTGQSYFYNATTGTTQVRTALSLLCHTPLPLSPSPLLPPSFPPFLSLSPSFLTLKTSPLFQPLRNSGSVRQTCNRVGSFHFWTLISCRMLCLVSTLCFICFIGFPLFAAKISKFLQSMHPSLHSSTPIHPTIHS